MNYDFSTVLHRFNTGSTKWEEMKKYGITDDSVVPLSNAEMEFRNAPEITEGLCDYIRSTVLSYFDPMPDYFEAVRAWHLRRHGFDIPAGSILPNCSLHAALCTAVRAFSQPGDGVIVMQPTWPGFLGAVRNTGRTLVTCLLQERDGKYGIDFDLLREQAAAPENKLLLLCSPHNPVGRVWTREELSQLAEICLEGRLILISDEIHADLTMPGYRHIPVASLSPETAARTVTFTGASKAFNLAGLDASNVIITDPDLRAAYKKARAASGLSTPNMLGLKACELAYTKGGQWLDQCVSVLAGNAAYVAERLQGGIPRVRCSELQGTYLMWLDFRALGMEDKALEEALMRSARLFMDDGYYFGAGGSGFVRMNIACPRAVLCDAMNRLERWVNSL